MADNPDPFIPRKIAASVISTEVMIVTERALREWQEPRTVIIGGRACARRSEWLEAARHRLVEAHHGQDPSRQMRLSQARFRRAALRSSPGSCTRIEGAE